SVAGPRASEGFDRAVRAALAMAGRTAREVDAAVGPRLAALEVRRWIELARLHGDAGAATSSWSLAAGVALVRRGHAGCVLRIAEPSESATCGIVITREEGPPHAGSRTPGRAARGAARSPARAARRPPAAAARRRRARPRCAAVRLGLRPRLARRGR